MAFEIIVRRALEKKMEVEIISRECIKPSSPTLHLKIHKFSFLDQHIGHLYTPRVLYYPLNSFYSSDSIDITVSTRLQLIKHSLSEILSHFYPLAGRIKDNFFIDCNDEGICFVQARAKSTTLNEFLSQPDLYLISKFVPVEQSGQIAGAYVGMVQVTSFACGGLVICLSISHFFGDAATSSGILKNWAAKTCRSTEEGGFPNFDASSMFPQIEPYPKDATAVGLFGQLFRTGRFVTRRIVFDANAIANLKAKATGSSAQNPTRVEVVSAFLSKRIMAASHTNSGIPKPTLISDAVNLRRKALPQFSERSLGNIIWSAKTLCKDEKVKLHDLVFQLRESITKINSDFVKSLQGDEGPFHLFEAIKDNREACFDARDMIEVTSWCNLGCYDVDFGWGNPIWVSFVGSDGTIIESSRRVILMDTRLRDGIEAWACLHEEEMVLLEVDKELLAFATLDPSPLA